jgi:hypothetical protein
MEVSGQHGRRRQSGGQRAQNHPKELFEGRIFIFHAPSAVQLKE